MNKRDEILEQALKKNENESQRWQTFLEENETAIKNMTMFGKQLTVDVMVPVGKKAFMAGYLLHTNEVLVSHYQGYFSQCTTFKAKEICELRIKMSKEYLKRLEMEADLWKNKLYKPYTEGAMRCGEEREIIEDFCEETEKLWRENHKIRVKQAKENERIERERQQTQNSDDKKLCGDERNNEIFKILEEAELMEELEEELDALNVNDVSDETIRKLMSGEVKLQNKRRLAHQNDLTEKNISIETEPTKNKSKNIVEIRSSQMSTNNNTQPNPEIMDLVNSQEEEVEVEELFPVEAKLIKEQAKYLNIEDQIGFYDYQIQIIRQKLQILPLRTKDDLNEKILLLNILEHLEELLEEAEEAIGEKELSEKSKHDVDIENNEEISEQTIKTETKFTETPTGDDKSNVKRISFALEDQTLEFRNHEAVTHMFPPKIEKTQRDIKLAQEDKYKLKVENSFNKRDSIQVKVEKNLQFVEENQSKQDFDLVQKILQSSKGDIKTLHIRFKHSHQEGHKSKVISDMPSNPADMYDFYTKSQKKLENDIEPSTFFINSYEGEEQVNAPVMKEADRHTSFVDPKSEFSNPLHTKSILKNKNAVEKENHYGDAHQHSNNEIRNVNKKCSKKEDDGLSVYYKVMNEVVEKPLTEPEPLPDVKFIDAHAPKKRISRFKQIRQGNGKI